MYTMDCYSAIKKNDVRLLAGKWMEMEILMLSEISQTYKDNYYMSHMQNLDLKK
jgi:hypothetical protein